MFTVSSILDSSAQGMNCFRMIRGYVDHATTPGGAVAYIGNLASWDHVFKDTLYATQEIFGDAVAVRAPTHYDYTRPNRDLFYRYTGVGLCGTMIGESLWYHQYFLSSA